ncbi:MAG: heavy metal-binding domain-containing protein [Pseudomonadota bacterium]
MELEEARHYASLRVREHALRHIQVLTLKRPPRDLEGEPDSHLVMGSVVISVDYFKRFIASLITLIGGRIFTYETLVERARREAILRMKEQAKASGAFMICNVKLETSSISKGFGKDSLGSVEVLAYGTALSL